jgi:hypothetical protein
MVSRSYGRGGPLNAPAAFIHPCHPVVARDHGATFLCPVAKILVQSRIACRQKFWLALRLLSAGTGRLPRGIQRNHNERAYSEDECAGGASRADSSNMAAGNRRHRVRRYGRLDMFFGLWIHQTNRATNLN